MLNGKRESATVTAYLVMLAAALIALGITAANAWAAPARPDLVVSGVEARPTAVLPGGMLDVRSAVTNVGAARAGRSTVRLYLSADRFRSAGDLVLAERATRGLRPGGSTAMSVAVVLPAGIAPGSYSVVACADARRVVAERRERNNCRGTATPIAVVVPAAPEGPEDGSETEHGHDHDEHDHGEAPEPSAG